MNTSRQLLFVSLGVLFWFVAAIIVRFFGDAVFTENNPYLILMFVLTIPITFGFLFITQKVANLSKTELLRPIVIITFTAAFLDGIAMTWFRKLYSESFEVSFYGSALILWGVGMGLFLAHFLANKKA
jgi:hypothetical protein